LATLACANDLLLDEPLPPFWRLYAKRREIIDALGR